MANDKHLIAVELDKEDSSFKQLLDYKYINFKSEGKDNIFINRDYAISLMTDFLRLQVANGNLIPKEGFEVDLPTPDQMKEVADFIKDCGF